MFNLHRSSCLQDEQIALRKMEEERRHQYKLQSQRDRRRELKWCTKKRDIFRVSFEGGKAKK